MIDQARNLRAAFADVNITASVVATPMTVPAIRTCKSISVTSGKGGVGKTNICLSLAVCLAQLKKKVCILDADLGLANIHLLLGIAPQKTLHHYLKKECSISEVILDGPAGVHIIPGASGVETIADLDALSQQLFIRELAALENRYDFLLVDTGAGIGRVATGFAAMTDRVLLVVTPEPTSLADAYAVVKVLSKRPEQPISVLVNMARSDTDGKETFDRLNALVVKFLKRTVDCVCVLPFDKNVGSAVRKQNAFVLSQPNSPFALRMRMCAKALNGGSTGKQKQGFFERLSGL